MKTALPSVISFFVGGGIALAAWIAIWPGNHEALASSEPPPAASTSSRDRTSPDLSQLIASLDRATSPDERLKTSLRFLEFPVAEIPSALESIPLIHERRLTQPAKLLLARWAYHDGPAAATWSWLQFRDGGPWREAWREIGASWVTSDPSGLSKWAIQQSGGSFTEPSLAEALASDVPILTTAFLRDVTTWLVPSQPKLAYQTLLSTPGWSSHDHKLTETLTTTSEIRQALEAFENLDKMVPNRIEGNEQIHARTLMDRWRKIDPEDFFRSPFAHLYSPPASNPGASIQAPPLPSLQASWFSEFSVWRNQNTSYTRPDMTGWSAAKIRAWEDLEAIQAP